MAGAGADGRPGEFSHDGYARTLVLGLGNPLLRDDGLGLVVAERLKELLAGTPGVDVCWGPVAGFGLVELLSGYDRAFIIDAIQTPDGEPGTIFRLTPHSLPSTERLAGDHEIDLPTALELGRRLGLRMPSDVVIIAVEAEDIRTFGVACTPRVLEAVDTVTGMVAREVTAGQSLALP